MTALPDARQLLETLRQTKAGMQRISSKLSEPLAIVGVGCRFPDCDGPDQYWQMLLNGKQTLLRSGDRWSSALAADHEKQPGRITANRGGFLDSIDQFDTSFFGISGREAATLDPQQRLLLEVAWETLENAAIDPTSWRGRKVGAFVGICSNDYLHRLTDRPYETIDTYLSTGNSHGAAAGRLSYFMDWHGPAVAVDTACSSSLTALHLASRSLRYGDCDMALVMGVNLILAPELSISLSQAGMLSPTGRCHTFADAADGFARGEGCGAVLLKRLSQAENDGDRILCVVRGTAANQDGRSNGLTAPNGQSQEQVIRAALADAKLKPEDIDYVEAHGTGTPLGDPIEISALKSVFADCRSTGAKDRTPAELFVGSAKANLGHLEGAAGIAGVIKVALSLAHQTIPPHPSLGEPSKRIDWNWPVKIPQTSIDWAPSKRLRMAGVSSFGFGGSNVHVVLGEHVASASADVADSKAQPTRLVAELGLVVISAKSLNALKSQLTRWGAFLKDAQPSFSDVCLTAAVGRASFEQRLAIIATSTKDLIEVIERAAQQLSEDQGTRIHIGNLNAVDTDLDEVRLENLKKLAGRFVAGTDIEWVHESELPWSAGAKRINLPTYPYQRVRRWYDEAAGRTLLGRHLDVAGETEIFETDLSAFQYLKEHVVEGTPIFPASAYFELAVASGFQASGRMQSVLQFRLLRPIILANRSESNSKAVLSVVPCVSDIESIKVQVHLRPTETGNAGTISVKIGNAWETAATFQLGHSPLPQRANFATLKETLTSPSKTKRIQTEDHYLLAASLGLDYGPSFRCLEQLCEGLGELEGQAFGTVCPRRFKDCNELFHPAALDACLQVAAAGIANLDATWLPAAVTSYTLYKQIDYTKSLQVSTRSYMNRAEERLVVDVHIEEPGGVAVADIQGLQLKRLEKRNGKASRRNQSADVSSKDSIPENTFGSTSLMEFLHVKVADVMGLTIEEIPLNQPLDSLGLDSLMAFELRDELERKFQISLPMELFLDDITIETFCNLVEEKIQLESSESWVEGEI